MIWQPWHVERIAKNWPKWIHYQIYEHFYYAYIYEIQIWWNWIWTRNEEKERGKEEQGAGRKEKRKWEGEMREEKDEGAKERRCFFFCFLGQAHTDTQITFHWECEPIQKAKTGKKARGNNTREGREKKNERNEMELGTKTRAFKCMHTLTATHQSKNRPKERVEWSLILNNLQIELVLTAEKEKIATDEKNERKVYAEEEDVEETNYRCLSTKSK